MLACAGAGGRARESGGRSLKGCRRRPPTTSLLPWTTADRLGQARMRSSSKSAEQGEHRLAALAALASAAVLAALSIDIVLSQFPRGLIVLACLVLAFAAAWYGLTRTGGARLLGSGIA